MGSQYMGKKLYILLLGVIITFIVCGSTSTIAKFNKEAKIIISANPISIYQEEKMPNYEVTIVCKGRQDIILDSITGYKVGDLLKELNSGKRYTIESDADQNVEGVTSLNVLLSEDTIVDLRETWKDKVTIVTNNAEVVVKNKYGEWDGDKFIRRDGSNVISDWISSKGNVYYFDEKGIKVTGWKDIGDFKYYFDDSGIRKTGWFDFEGSKYYFNSNGEMAIGWLALEGQKYFMDIDGKMVTGARQIGSKKCVFSETGILQSITDYLDVTKPMIALTFDDGPGKGTEQILAVLEQYNAHATFFMLGNNISKYPDVVKRMAASGNEIGNHTMSHANLSKISGDQIVAEINGVNDKLTGLLGRGATVMRPPWGAVNDNVKAKVEMPLIMWSIDTLDWKTKNTQATIDNVLNTATNGDIVLMHDIHDTSVAAAITLIPELINRGYQLVTVSELAEAKGVTLQKGSSYFDFK